MKKIRPIIFCGLMSILASCVLTRGHFTKDGGFYIWNKNPGGRYNTHNPLQIDNATAWVKTVSEVRGLRKLEIESFSKKWDDYRVNDTGVFISKGNLFKGKEQVNYKSAKTMARQLHMTDSLLIKLIKDFDKLGLNRFYKEQKFMAFETETFLNSVKGYFYFNDTSLVKAIGDTLDLKNYSTDSNFRHGLHCRYIVTNRISDNWIEWKEVR